MSKASLQRRSVVLGLSRSSLRSALAGVLVTAAACAGAQAQQSPGGDVAPSAAPQAPPKVEPPKVETRVEERLAAAAAVAAPAATAAPAKAPEAPPPPPAAAPAAPAAQPMPVEAIQAKATDPLAIRAAKPRATDTERRTSPMSIGVDEVVEQPDRYYGRSVSVGGDVEALLGPQGFTLDEDSVTATTDLLVLVPQPVAGLAKQAEVIATGALQRFTRAEFERDYPWFEAKADALAKFEGRPVVIADSVRTAEGRELLDRSLRAGRGGAVEVTAAALARNPRRYFGRTAMIRAEVEDVLGRNLFTLDEDALYEGPDVLVIIPQPKLAFDDGAEVMITGQVQRFVFTEMRKQFNWLDIERERLVSFEGRPVLVADSVVAVEPEAPESERPPQNKKDAQ